MQTLFDLKTNLPFDNNVFKYMNKMAAEVLQNAEKSQYTQAIVLLSSKQNVYTAIINNALAEGKTDELFLLQKLNTAKDTAICYILCMWQDACIDIPSFSFRKMICDLSPQNDKCLIFVMTQSGVSVIKLANTMK